MTESAPPVSTVGVVTDSSCDLPADLASRWGIEVVPLTIRFGDEEFVDREELSTAEFWAALCPVGAAAVDGGAVARPLRAGLPRPRRSGAPGRRRGHALRRALGDDAERRARRTRAVADDGIDVRVVDSRTVSLGLGTIALAAARRAADGADVEAVEQLARELVDRTRVFGALDTLENLKKGGRIGNAKALLATALSIKPIIEVAGGVVEQHGKQRTRSKALAFLVEKVASLRWPHREPRRAPRRLAGRRRVRRHAASPLAREIVVGQIGPVIGAHAGRGTIGVAFQERP